MRMQPLDGIRPTRAWRGPRRPATAAPISSLITIHYNRIEL
jgi:hypothetical protein